MNYLMTFLLREIKPCYTNYLDYYKELTPYGIYVTAICPNLVATEMTSDVSSIKEHEFVRVDDVVKVVDMLMTVSSNVLVKEIVLQNRTKFIQSLMGYKRS